MTNQQNEPPQQRKKQVRRRLHAIRPYQEKLLNMAEARREIVTALKFHRAAMEKANEKQQQQQQKQQQLLQTTPLSCDFEQETKLKSRRNPRIYPSTTTNFYNNNLCGHVSQSPMPYPMWCNFQSNFVPLCDQNLSNFPLPNQPLGLNLNFHDFNIETTNVYSNPTSSASSSSSSSSSSSLSSSSSPPTIATATDFHQEVKPMMMVPEEVYNNEGMHQAIDDEEMAEMRTIGDQHQMEWNDSLVTSSWWFKFFHTIETGPDGKTEDDHDNNNSYSYFDYCNPFDEIMEFPSWLNPNDDSSFDQPHFDDYCSPEYYTDPSLPCMDIGEFEGMDGEWLA